MADVTTETVTLALPKSTMELLRRFAAARNSPLDNAASAAIRDGIEAVCVLHPHFRARAGLPEPHPMSTARRLTDGASV